MIEHSGYAFIFDMDGTLVDNMRFHTEAWQMMLAENGVEMDPEEFLVRTSGKTNREIIPGIFPDAGEDEVERYGERKETLYRELFLEHRRPVRGAVEFLEAARELGIPMAVATAAPTANVEFILDGLDLRKYFAAVTTAADVANGKPDPEFFTVSAAKLGIAPEKCLVFEDALNGFEAARRAGMKAIGITTVNSAEALISLESVVAAYADFESLDPRRVIEQFLLPRADANVL
ncbi:MAG: HAD family hydrolase [Pyrinomonadaceae bacterium]